MNLSLFRVGTNSAFVVSFLLKSNSMTRYGPGLLQPRKIPSEPKISQRPQNYSLMVPSKRRNYLCFAKLFFITRAKLDRVYKYSETDYG